MPTSTYFTGPIEKRMSDDLHLAGVAEGKLRWGQTWGKLRWGQTWFSVFNRITNRRADDLTKTWPLESRRNLGPT